jgi:hypothetical protein
MIMKNFLRSPRAGTAMIFISAAFLAAAFRAAAVDNDLWLDEVWSVKLATDIASPIDIVTSVHHDNNHYLNTLWLWCCSPDAGVIVMRSLSVVTGVIAVLLTGLLTLRWGRFAAAVAMTIASVSILLVQYSTEARGYSAALCSALAAHWILRRHLSKSTLMSGVVFSMFCVLGTLSHLSFLQYYFAAVFWSAGRLSADRPGNAVWCWRMIRCHAVAIVGLGAVYVLDVRYLNFGGGPRLQAFGVLQNAVSVFAGGPLDHPARSLVCVSVILGIIAGLRSCNRRGDDEWKFFACLFLLFPVFRVVLLPASMMFERYFLIPLGFAVVPLSVCAAQLAHGKLRQKLALGVAAMLFLFGNLSHFGSLVRNGRGQYQRTMSMISVATPGVIRISSDHPFRNRVLIEHYASRCQPPRQIEYVNLDDWSNPPEWMICHHLPRDNDAPVNYFEKTGQPRSSISVSGVSYSLAQRTTTGSLSCCEWLCYRLADHVK